MLNVIKQLQVDKRIRLGYGAAFILLLVSYLLTLYANRQLMQQTKTIIRTNHIIINLEDLVSDVKDAEAGVKAYLFTKKEKSLLPYHSSHKKVDSAFSLLKTAAENSNFKQSDIDVLQQLVNKKYDYLKSSLQYYAVHRNTIPDSIINTGYESKAVMDTLRSIIKSMQSQEASHLVEKTALLSSRYSLLNIFIIISLVLASLFAFFGLLTYIRENAARKISDNKVIEFQKQLQLRIDELGAANKELLEMRRIEKFAATGRIARSIAHEVRNPLTNIDLAVGQIKSEMPAMDEGATMLFDMVNRNSKRINQLITELLNATRFAELTYQPVSINTLLDEALELAKDRIALAQITIEKQYADGLCDINADIEKVKIAFLNIIVNAVEAIEKDGGLLKIITRRKKEKCVVEFTDNGKGMDELALGKLFEPYFTSKQKGNGLGLTNTQNIILNHKGSITVESKPGVGTTFIIEFYFMEKQ